MTAYTVESYSGYRADETPLRFVWAGRKVVVRRMARRWLEPDAECFRVIGDDGLDYELRLSGGSWVVLCRSHAANHVVR